ncbi:MAG: hypothetical protein OEU26_09185 [Candidatus Tectomicrobia bacterium]|nr:hypothetical protein [Candidatus Tectomicrobia bacterium]
MRPGEIYRVRLDLHVTSNYFGPGHRIRLEDSSSNFPRWDRNLNTGGNNYDESEFVVAENTVHHTAEYPSYIVIGIKNFLPAKLITKFVRRHVFTCEGAIGVETAGRYLRKSRKISNTSTLAMAEN